VGILSAKLAFLTDLIYGFKIAMQSPFYIPSPYKKSLLYLVSTSMAHSAGVLKSLIF
jgi:hypothetical protein